MASQTFALLSRRLSGYIVYDMTHYDTLHARPPSRWDSLKGCVALALLLLFTTGCGSESRENVAKSVTSGARKGPEKTLGGLPMSQFFIEHDRFGSVTDPATVRAGDAYFVSPDDEVYGVVVDGRARAYPVRMISYYHVVNDTIADVPIAVTY